MWRFEKGIPKQDSYFDIDVLENQSPLPDGQFFDEMAETFKNILPRYFAGQPVGIALTGGLDTRMIMSCLPGNIGPTAAFTYGGMDRDCVDVKLARKVAAVCGLHHQTIRLDKTFLRNYADHAIKSIYVTDGLAHATNVEGVYLNHLARDIAPVKLTGKFGSQILGKVRRALRKRFPNEQLIHPDFKRHLLPASEALLPYEKEHTISFVLQREIPWFWATATAQEISQLSVRSPFLDNDLIRLLYRAPRSGFEGSVFQLDFIAKNNPALAAIRTNKGKGGRGFIFSRAIEMSYKTRGMMDKALTWDVLPHNLHHLVARVDAFILSPLHLDQLLIGFEHFRQYTRWFRTEMASQVKAILLDPRTLQRPYWNSQYIVRMLNDHLAGRGRYLSEIRKVLTIELIHRALVEDIESI
jgi:asparagine synthase (glutamine-hydrolysing)